MAKCLGDDDHQVSWAINAQIPMSRSEALADSTLRTMERGSRRFDSAHHVYCSKTVEDRKLHVMECLWMDTYGARL